MSDDFKINPDLKDRISFWFDIYTKYSAQEQVIHHAMYPWIIYRVVDLRPILNADGNKWTKYHKSVKFAKSQARDVRAILGRLARKKNFDHLNDQEQEIYAQIQKVPNYDPTGKNRKKIILEALHNVRTQVGQKDFVEQGLQSAELYMPELEKVFAERGIPLELTRLPFVESSFNTAAVSKVGASGIWQVMPYIGRKFLMMNPVVDERNSPVKSAIVAAYLFKENKKILKNWPLAITAYNHGTGDLAPAVKRLHTDDLAQIIKRYKNRSFGFASQNFYCSFMAVLYAEKYRDLIFNDFDKSLPLKFVKVKLSRATKVYKFLELTGMDPDEFKKYNLDIKKIAFKRNMLLPRGFVVHVPENIAADLLTKNQTIAKMAEGSSPQAL
jgi:membrane-bound lytic murein transglycosylase D